MLASVVLTVQLDVIARGQSALCWNNCHYSFSQLIWLGSPFPQQLGISPDSLLNSGEFGPRLSKEERMSQLGKVEGEPH